MSTQVQTQTLRERAEEALQARKQKDAEDANREFEREERHLRKKISEVLGAQNDVEIFQTSNRAMCVIEELTFGVEMNTNGDYALVLVQKCPNCSEQITGWWIYSLETLGKALSGEINNWRHREGECVKKAQREPETTEARLLQALRDFIAEHSYQG